MSITYWEWIEGRNFRAIASNCNDKTEREELAKVGCVYERIYIVKLLIFNEQISGLLA